MKFNPDIANTFFRAGMIESWGRGIERIMLSCRKEGVREPLFRSEPAGLWVEFSFVPIHPNPVKNDGLGDGLGDSPQGKILKLIKNNKKFSIIEMSRQLGVSTTAVEKSLRRMKNNGRIRRVGSAKSGYWEIIGDK